MYRLLRVLISAATTFALSGCMALAVAPFVPIVNSLGDKPASLAYSSGIKATQVFNSALKVLSARGSTTTVDRETGVIRGTIAVSMGQSAYSVVINVDETNGRTMLRINVKLEGMVSYSAKNAGDLATELALEIERQIGSKLERV